MYGEKIAKFINAILRKYLRDDEIEYPTEILDRISLQHSFPKDILEKWIEYWGVENTEKLCIYYNRPPNLHIRINTCATNKRRLMEYLLRREIIVIESDASDNILVTDQARDVLNEISFSEGFSQFRMYRLLLLLNY